MGLAEGLAEELVGGLTEALLNKFFNKPSVSQAAVIGGFETVTTPTTELEDIKWSLEDKNILSSIGIGEANDEMVARNVSADEARKEVAKFIDVHVQRLSESYAQNVGSEAKKSWEEAVKQIADQYVKSSNVCKTIALFNKESGQHKIYSLVILNPAHFKAAITGAMARDKEFEMCVKKDEMMSMLDASIAEYEKMCRG